MSAPPPDATPDGTHRDPRGSDTRGGSEYWAGLPPREDGADQAPEPSPESAADPAAGPASGPAHPSGRVRRAVRSTAYGISRGVGVGATGARRGASYAFRQARRASHAKGAGDSGLYRLIELHAFNAAGDAAVAIALAGTIFFANPGEARGNVALFLGLTMLPFAVVAPLLGPFLDKFSHGRRWAIGATMAIRAFLCWAMADAISSSSILMYPCALGVLVSSKAYGVARAATVPRLLPEQLTLVKANSRISLSGVVGGAISGPIAALAATAGAEWALRYAFVVFCGATILAILLPGRADASAGEQSVAMSDAKPKRGVPSSVVFALRCNAGLRMLSGFMTMFMAFLLKQHPLPGWEDRATLLMGLVIGAAGLGNTLGLGLTALLRKVNPGIVVVVALLADATIAVVAAFFYGLITAIALGSTAGIAQAMGKLALDATIQEQVPERNRTSAFARSETLLQLSWVVGGFIGIALPLIPEVGLGVLAALMVAWTTLVLVSRRRSQVGVVA